MTEQPVEQTEEPEEEELPPPWLRDPLPGEPGSPENPFPPPPLPVGYVTPGQEG